MARDKSKRRIESDSCQKTGKRRIKILLSGVCLLALCGAIRYYWGTTTANAGADDRKAKHANQSTTLQVRPSSGDRSPAAGQPTQPTQPTQPAESGERGRPSIPAVVARVNFRRITRQDLARECLVRHGEKVLESMVNKRLIVQACRQRGVSVSRDEVREEIERMAKRFGIPVDQWLQMLEHERNITADQYASEIIWPMLALRKLAGSQMAVGREELMVEYETLYGEAVRARLIAVSSPDKAEKAAGAGGGPPRGVRQSGQEPFRRCVQRQRQGRDSSDTQARHLQGDRAGCLQHGRR